MGSFLEDEIKSTLISRNVTVMGRRTSIRLEPDMWKALKEIASREQCTIHDICTLVKMRKKETTSLTAAIRVFMMLYFRAATTEEGHRRASHGSFSVMAKRARLTEEDAAYFSCIKPMPSNNDVSQILRRGNAMGGMRQVNSLSA
ncbi:MAG: hypothetical protein CL570_01275 [Alphaproteobacteria bacterium]|nr:hypothetical protein [Alphaproteobacteria bacterium]HCQ71686.1 hypothetical protein [Rhodospirillaceae bacterium]|tara:strand:+ start:79580 stop:80014 length:435 start_codon:yes stop_codon:yes gene_type:complete